MAREEYYEEEEYHRAAPRRDRDLSPAYHSGGGARRSPSPSGAPYPRSSGGLLVPPSAGGAQRPRSVPPPNTAVVSRPRSRRDSFSDYSDSEEDRYRSRSSVGHRNRSRNRRRDSDDRPHSPLDKVKHIADKNFTNTPTGIGASLLGAVVGGLVAREASAAAQRHKHTNKPPSPTENRTRLASTIVGALAGGLGANAIANRVEDGRHKDKETQRAWEQKWGRDGEYSDEERNNGGRGRERGRLGPPPEKGGRSRSRGGYSDDDDDYVYNDRRRSRGRIEDDRYR